MEAGLMDPEEEPMFPCKSRLCVICVSGVVLGEGDEGRRQGRELMLDDDDDDQDESDDAISPEVFLKGISILCENLKIGEEGKFGTAGFWDLVGVGMGNFVRIICCRNCYGLFKRLVTLQKLIAASQRSLTENVNKLESAVIQSVDSSREAEFSFNSCLLFRNKVLSNYEQRSNLRGHSDSGPVPPAGRKRVQKKPGPARSKPRNRSQTPVTADGNLDPCFVKLEALENHGELESRGGLDDSMDGESILPLDVDYDDDNDGAFMDFSGNVPASSSRKFKRVKKEDEDEDFRPTKRRRGVNGGKRGRPRKKLTREEMARLLIKRKRGRPAKPRPLNVIKRPRGRPAKPKPLNEIKRPRGRPKKDSDQMRAVEGVEKVKVDDDVEVIEDSYPDATLEEGSSTSLHSYLGESSPHQESEGEYQPVIEKPIRRSKSRPRNSGRPSGRPRKKKEHSITVGQAKDLISESSYIKPVVIIDPENKIYSYSNVRMQRENTTLFCKHPNCDFYVEDMANFSDQLAFRTMKGHIKYFHRHRSYRIYTNRDNEKSDVPDGSVQVYSCCYCDEQVANKNDLVYHVKDFHATAEPTQALCEVCGDSMLQQSLSKHLYTHKNEEEKKVALAEKSKRPGKQKDTSVPLDFPCNQCDKVCKNQTLLRIHQNSHVPIEIRKQYICDVCGERLSTHNILRNHRLRVHFKTDIDYAYTCNICNKKYTQAQKIKYEVHMRLHTGELPFQCPTCGKGFRCKYSMRKHERTHQDIQIQCEFCSQTYRSNKNLKVHHRKHHPELIDLPNPADTEKYLNADHRPDFIGPKMAHPCEPCGRVYVFKSQLVAHMRHRHKLDLPKTEDYPEQNTFEMQHLRDLQKARAEIYANSSGNDSSQYGY